MFEERRKDSRYYAGDTDDDEKMMRYQRGWQYGDSEREARRKWEKDQRARKRYERLLRKELGVQAPRKKKQWKKGRKGSKKARQKKTVGGR